MDKWSKQAQQLKELKKEKLKLSGALKELEKEKCKLSKALLEKLEALKKEIEDAPSLRDIILEWQSVIDSLRSREA